MESREAAYGIRTISQNVSQNMILHEPMRRGKWQYQVIRISGESRLDDLNDRGDYLCAALYNKGVILRNSLQ